MMPAKPSPVQYSQQLLYAVRTDAPVDSLLSALSGLPFDVLVAALPTDKEKKAFWINCYNAFTQIMLRRHPEAYQSRTHFFGDKQIQIAGQRFSLDAIEHGILRRSRIKWGLGYLQKPFVGKTEKVLRVDTVDYRIHFALNCGAKSCPPIAYYTPEKLDQQLDLATKAYLSAEATYDTAGNTIHLPKIMSWFQETLVVKAACAHFCRMSG